MLYTMTYKEKTEELEHDFYTSLMRDILLRRSQMSITIPLYVYEHRKEYVEELLSRLGSGARELLELWYENDMDGEAVVKIIKERELPIICHSHSCTDLIYELANDESKYVFEKGAYRSFPLNHEYVHLKRTENIVSLRKQIIEEIEAYTAGEERAFVYLTEILRKQPDCVKEPLPLDLEIYEDERFTFSVGAYSYLCRAGVKTLGELMNLSIEDMMQSRNLGKRFKAEIVALQKEARTGWFLGKDPNIFEQHFPAAMIKVLLEHGYFFWSGMKNELDEIDKLLEEAGLEELREPFRNYAREKFVKEINGDEEVTLTFQRVLDEITYYGDRISVYESFYYPEMPDTNWDDWEYDSETSSVVVPEITEFEYINQVPFFKEKVEIIYKFLDEERIRDAINISLALIEAIGVAVLEKVYSVKVASSQLAVLAFELFGQKEDKLAKLFLSANGDANVMSGKDDGDIVPFLYDIEFLLKTLAEDHEDMFVKFCEGEKKESVAAIIEDIRRWARI